MELEKNTEQVLLGSIGRGEERVVAGWGGQRGEMTQTMYAHLNKWIIKTKQNPIFLWVNTWVEMRLSGVSLA
jgi:hypothetical protein